MLHTVKLCTSGAAPQIWLTFTAGRVINGQQLSHLVGLPRRRVRLAQRGHWLRTCWPSALWSSTACPRAGRTLGTWESLPPCPNWPVPSCSSLPGTDTSRELEKHKIISKALCLKDIFIIQYSSDMLEDSISTRVKDCQDYQPFFKTSHNSVQLCTITITLQLKGNLSCFWSKPFNMQTRKKEFAAVCFFKNTWFF